MKTLEQIKNEYAFSKGFNNWEYLVYQLGYNRPSRLLDCIDRVIIIAQKECLKLASERLINDVDKVYVNNQNNIIK